MQTARACSSLAAGWTMPPRSRLRLKLKEISYIHFEAYAAGELKHGTISLIEEGPLVVALATQPALFEKTVSNIREGCSARRSVVLVTTDDFTGDESVCSTSCARRSACMNFPLRFRLFRCSFWHTISQWSATADVDKPRNLAKSVTVE